MPLPTGMCMVCGGVEALGKTCIWGGGVLEGCWKGCCKGYQRWKGLLEGCQEGAKRGSGAGRVRLNGPPEGESPAGRGVPAWFEQRVRAHKGVPAGVIAGVPTGVVPPAPPSRRSLLPH